MLCNSSIGKRFKPKWKKIRILLLMVFLSVSIGGFSAAKEVPFALEDRDRLIRIETKVQEIDKRFEELRSFLWILSGVFTSLVIAIVGFALWDGRTVLREARREHWTL